MQHNISLYQLWHLCTSSLQSLEATAITWFNVWRFNNDCVYFLSQQHQNYIFCLYHYSSEHNTAAFVARGKTMIFILSKSWYLSIIEKYSELNSFTITISNDCNCNAKKIKIIWKNLKSKNFIQYVGNHIKNKESSKRMNQFVNIILPWLPRP